MTCGYSSPLASCTENTRGVEKCARAPGLSSSRNTTTACCTEARVRWLSSRRVASRANSNCTEPAWLEAHCTRKLLSRSIEPNRACLILSKALANSVTLRVFRKLACNTDSVCATGFVGDRDVDCVDAPSPGKPCQNRARTADQEKKFGCTI